jgi:hypothetical protein
LHKKLGITQAFSVMEAAEYRFSEASGVRVEDMCNVAETFELYWRLASTRENPGELGSAGLREGVITPVIVGKGRNGHDVAAPVIEVDRTAGDYAGGRWLLANFRGTVNARLVRMMAERALAGVRRLEARAQYACLRPGESPAIEVTLSRPGARSRSEISAKCVITISNAHGESLATVETRLEGAAEQISGLVSVPASLSPGLFHIHASCTADDSSPRGMEVHAHNGFWVFDPALMAGGPLMGVDADFITRDGKPYPITGTTYMASDVHRWFLLEPNPWLWNADFRAMKGAGVNAVRTGLWTGWKKVSTDGRAIQESSLRALDAFLLTARRYDIPVIFTLFAFLPEEWGGENPYFDPSSAAAQRSFVEILARRYRAVNDLAWDLINEPSFSSREHLWKTRPNYDRHEHEAWRRWVHEERVQMNPGGAPIPLAEAWKEEGIDAESLPSLEDFDDVAILEGRQPQKAVAYKLFAQAGFARWAAGLAGVIRKSGNPRQLVTVGQDEGGIWERPSPWFFGESVDFTCNHSWWQNDDLVWDSVMSRIGGKPALIEETGVMFNETLSGGPWRSEQEAANLLERKLAISFGASGAGFIQWLWNTNLYIPSDNEASIGFLRADGTAKPELDVFMDYARLYREHRDLLGKREPENVVMVIPQSGMYSVRDNATEGTRRCVRTMEYACDTPLRAANEFDLRKGLGNARLILLPSPAMLSEAAWEPLMAAVEAGAVLLVTGTVNRDQYGRKVDRLRRLGIEAAERPVSQTEEVTIDGARLQAEYRGEKMQRLARGEAKGTEQGRVQEVRKGKGVVLWMPLPLELADNTGSLESLYRFALKRAGIEGLCRREERDPGVLIRPSVFPGAVMYTLVSERSEDRHVRFTHLPTRTTIEAALPAGRAFVVFIDKKSGKILP